MLKFVILRVSSKDKDKDKIEIEIERDEKWISEHLLMHARELGKQRFKRKKTRSRIQSIVDDALSKTISEFKKLTINLP